MYSVLLCDDELAITQFMKNNLPWESLGVETVYTAADGLAALEILGGHPVDLIITDIRMPRMDGLQLLKEVRERYPLVHCVLLTAYGEFEYARAAFLMGIDNYLLKPIQIEELTETIENTVENLYLSRKNEAALFRENILRRWLSGSISEDELSERSSILGEINIYQSQYCAVCMTKAAHHVSLTALSEILPKRFSQEQEKLDCLHVWDNQGRYVLIISGRNIDRDRVRAVLDESIRQMSLAGKVTAVIGPCVRHSESLPSSYQQAAAALDHRVGQRSAESLYQSAADAQGNHAPSYQARMSDQPVWLTEEEAAAQPQEHTAFDEESLSPIVRKVLEYIRANYAKGVSLKEFCATHTITTAYLGFLFKKETGTFFNNYLTAWRLDRAIELLEKSHEKVNVIGEMVGFTSTSYFISSFKKYKGMSPQKYRENNQP